MRWWPYLLLAAGCGRLGFDGIGVDAKGPPSDGSSDALEDAPAIDAPTEPAVCRTDPRYGSRGAQPHLYRIVSQQTSWTEAKLTCARDGAYLAIPSNATEVPLLDGDWMGLTDVAAEGQWLTVRGEAAPFLPWGTGEPAGGLEKNCARLDTSLERLEARECSDLRDYVCECD